jgi:hypothetical protein
VDVRGLARHYLPVAESMPVVPEAVWFEDVRGSDRRLRLSVHHETDGNRMVLSVWRGAVCRASFQLDRRDLGALIEVLVGASAARDGLSELEPLVDHLREANREETGDDLADVVTFPVA